jgi:hypothetical protein
MKKLIQNNTTFTLGEFTDMHETLPVGNYVLKFDEQKGIFYLQEQEPFVLPPKLYGDFSFIERWKKSYVANTGKNLGILLSGVKGTGKTISAQKFCIEMEKPVIFITENYSGPGFESFITSSLFNDCIIFIDEYEKLYQEDRDEAEKLLTLMDGVYNTRFIFLLTVNDPDAISDKLKNRLNRVKYHKVFETLEKSIIDGIVNDMLEDEQFKDSIYEFILRFGFITPDILVTLIKEVNFFKESALVCASYLNLSYERAYYQIKVVYKGEQHSCESMELNPMVDTFRISFYDEVPKELTNTLPYKIRFKMRDYPFTRTESGYTFEYNSDIQIQLSTHQRRALVF